MEIESINFYGPVHKLEKLKENQKQLEKKYDTKMNLKNGYLEIEKPPSADKFEDFLFEISKYMVEGSVTVVDSNYNTHEYTIISEKPIKWLNFDVLI